MPTVVCPRCNKRLESDMYDDDGNITAPSHMKTGLTRWCEPPTGPEDDAKPDDLPDDRATPGGRGPEAGGSRRAAAAMIEAALRERAQRSARAFAEEIERRRGRAPEVPPGA